MKRKTAVLLLCTTLILGNLAGCARPESVETFFSLFKKDISLYDIPIEYEDPHGKERTEIDFSEIENIRYENMEEFKASISRMEEICLESGNLEELKELYLWLYQEYTQIETAAVVSEIHYNLDMLDEELADISIHNDKAYSEAAVLYWDAVRAVLQTEYEEEFTDFIGEDVAVQFSGPPPLDSERLTELLIQESELVKEYDELYMRDEYSFTVEYDGKTWDIDSVAHARDELSEDEYVDIVTAITEEKGRAMTLVYLELVEVRKEIALQNGYDNPIDYYYEQVYNRDYSPEEAKEFHAAVKEYVAPVYHYVWNNTDYADAEVAIEEVIPVMETYLPQISPEMAEIFDYMIEHEMYILADDLEVSFDGGYTTFISGYGQPYVYNAVYGDYYSITGMVHEFGHYCDFYLNGLYGPGSPGGQYDLAEVSSTGLEMLFYQYFDEIFEGDAEEEKADMLCTPLWMIVTGCLFDEAQQKIFEYEGELTVEKVNEIFAQTGEEYGMRREFGNFWTEVTHNFEAPFYYISYAAASTAALEIWLTAENEGFEAGKEMYLEILSMGSFEYDYFEVLEACDMQGFKSVEFLQEVSQTVADAAMGKGGRIKTK